MGGGGAGRAQRQRRGGVFVDEGLFHCRLFGFVPFDDPAQAVLQLHKTRRQRQPRIRGDDAVGNMAEAVACGLDHAPAGVPKSRIKTDQSNGFLLFVVIAA